MAKQVINIGSVANDGTGDPLRTAFDKVNDNFTELYNDDAGDVNSVNAGTGISVDQSTGAVTVTNSSPNATHTGEVTGATALTIANDVITYDKLADEFTEKTTDSNLAFGTEAIHVATLSGATTLNIIGIPQGVTKTAVFTGGDSLAFGPGNTNTIVTGAYNPAVTNFIQIFNAGGTFPSADLYISISQPV